MEILRDFKFKLDKQHVLNVVATYLPIGDREDRGRIYDNLIEVLKDSTNPIGFFKIDEKIDEYNFESFINVNKIIYCLITLGEDITEKIESLFSQNKFIDAIILDAMASSLLFEYNTQMYDYLYNYFYEKGMGITCRIAPGDGEIPIEYQADIVNRLGIKENYNISIINGFAINPPKSMAYVHGADEKINKVKYLHSCKDCPNIHCNIRKVKERAKGVFGNK